MSNVHDLMVNGISQDDTLSSVYDIEDVLLMIGEIDHKIDYYKELKKHRVESIDTKINNLSEKTEALRSVILNTMKKMAPQDKTINFPDIGKVSRRTGQDVIAVTSETEVLTYLEKSGKKNEVVKVVETIDKRKLNSLVNECHKAGERVPGVTRTPGVETISITFEEKDEVETRVRPNPDKINLDALDTLLV